MELRTLLGGAILAGVGWVAYDLWRNGLGDMVSSPSGTGDNTTTDIPPYDGAPYDITAPSRDYLDALTQAENPSGNPYSKNPYSTASGLFQFTKATWESMGGQWGSDPTQAFGGLKPSVQEQYDRAAKLTQSNASVLDRLGIAVDNVSLYAAHMLNPTKAAAALRADPETQLTNILPSHTVAINPAIGKTVQSFLTYLQTKVG